MLLLELLLLMMMVMLMMILHCRTAAQYKTVQLIQEAPARGCSINSHVNRHGAACCVDTWQVRREPHHPLLLLRHAIYPGDFCMPSGFSWLLSWKHGSE